MTGRSSHPRHCIAVLTVGLAVLAGPGSGVAGASACSSPIDQLLGRCPPPPEPPPPRPNRNPPPNEPAPAPPPSAGMPAPPVGRLLGDAAAARRVRRSSWEPRPANRAVNRRMPTRSELRAFRRATRLPPRLRRRVTGHFTGTTDETIQWAAWKWGIAPDLLRAQATVESWWRMSAVGDRGQSFGLMQIRRTHRGTFPLSRRSTAFNVDYAAAVLRYYYDGNAGWMAHESENATAYRRGDLWGSVGAWYSGRWHTAPSEEYIARVHDHMVDRTWRRPGF